MTLLYQVLALLSGIVIFLRVEPVLNLMGPQCRLPVRLAFWLLAVGASGLVVMITQGYTPSFPVTLLAGGVALLLTSERRLHGLFNRREAAS